MVSLSVVIIGPITAFGKPNMFDRPTRAKYIPHHHEAIRAGRYMTMADPIEMKHKLRK